MSIVILPIHHPKRIVLDPLPRLICTKRDGAAHDDQPRLQVLLLGRQADPNSPFGQSLRKLHEKCGRTAEDGSRTLLHAVVAGKESHGLFLNSCKISEHILPDWIKNNLDAEKQMWELVARVIEEQAPGSVSRMLQCA
ncbi:hypothetical protein VTK26DRAFT_8836 [Humicola hyalothermophila]